MTSALFKRISYLIATVIAVAIVFRSYHLLPGLWLLTSAVLLVNISFEISLARRTLVIAVAGTVAALCVLCITLLASLIVLQILLLAVITAVCSYAIVKAGHNRYPWLVVNLLAILAVSNEAGMAAGLQSAGAIIASTWIVVFAQIILVPFYTRDEYRYSKLRVMRSLGLLLSNIVNCLVSPEYPDNVYLFERRVHKQKIKCLEYLTILAQRESALAPVIKESHELQLLFEIIIDVGQSRRRVTDHTIFSVCKDELDAIETDTVRLLAALAGVRTRDIPILLTKFDAHITQFESSYEHVLRVAAREPLPLLLLLSSLKNLLHALRGMSGEVSLQSMGMQA